MSALRRVGAALLLAGTLLARPAAAAEPEAAALLDKMQQAWTARDVAAYLALWRFSSEADRAEEQDWLEHRWSATDESRLQLQPPAAVNALQVDVPGLVFTVSEPRGRAEQVLYTLHRGADGWAIVRRASTTQIDGLIHVALGPEAYRADGLVVRFEDFDLHVEKGTVFTSPSNIGPTTLVFVGRMMVRFAPRPETEKEQLRQFCGRTELTEAVKVAMVRIHPADLHRVLFPARLDPAGEAKGALATAQRFYREHIDDAYVLDTPLPRSPWWLLPSLGDALVTFESRRGVLTYALSQAEAEGITLFDRARRRQIALYPQAGRSGRYTEDAGRDIDVLHHDLSVRFQPDRLAVSGEDRMSLQLLNPVGTIRLRLDESLKVTSIRSAEWGEHLFFRVRHQDSVMVSLGALAGRTGPLALTVRFAGVLRPEPLGSEITQVQVGPQAEEPQQEVPIEEALVYSNRSPWYPQGGSDDYATWRLRADVPAGTLAVAGGAQTSLRSEGGRTLVEYEQDRPGKYLTVAVARMAAAGGREESGVRLEAFAVPRLRPQAPARLAEAAAILRFYTSLFGPCPYRVLNLALVESKVPGGHSPPGMVVLNQRPLLLKGTLRDDPASFPELPDFFLAHELAHQWWGHGVTGENYHERWISEAFAQYAAALWIRESRGEDAFRSMLQRLSRWALRYSGQGPIRLGHRLGHLKGDPQIFRAVVYDKGAYVLHMLRLLVGDEAFRRALTSLQADRRFTKIGTDDVRAALEGASGMDLHAYFAAWLDGTRIPELSSSRHESRPAGVPRTEVRIRARDLPGPVPLEVTLFHDRGTEVRRVSLPPEGTSLTAEAVRRVELNRDRGLLVRIAK